MKKMNKVLSVCFVVILAIASLTGCKKSGGAGDTFKIGGLGPLTGDNASYGNSVKNGAQIAVDEINAAGGVDVDGKKIKMELIFEDDQAKEDIAVNAYSALMDEKVDAILGAVTSGACLAITDLTKEDGILQITPSGSAKDCTKNDNAFRLCFTDPLQGVTMANFATEDLGKKKAAVIFDNSSDYSKGVKDAFEEQYKANGGEIVASESFVSGDVDFSSQLSTIKSSAAEIIFIPAYYKEVSLIAKQAADSGIKLPYIGSDGWDGVLAQVTDPAVVEGAIFLSPFFAADEAENVKNFVNTYNEKFGSTPDQFAADGYDTVYVMKAAIEKAGSTKSADLIKAMTEISYDGLTGSIKFTADGEPDKLAKFIEIKNGQYTSR